MTLKNLTSIIYLQMRWRSLRGVVYIRKANEKTYYGANLSLPKDMAKQGNTVA